jgi:dsDNA-specific endonuclease/ATPase MutS2
LNELVLSDSLEEIELMLDEVEEASILRQRLGRISILFKSSVKKSIEKTMKMGVLSTDELLQVGKFLDGLKGLYLYLDELTNYQINAPLFKEKVYKIDYPKSLNMEIKHIINQFGEINDDASSELKDIRKRIKDHEKGIDINYKR